MEASGNENNDAITGNTGGFEAAQDVRENFAIRRGTRDVADRDGSGTLALGEFGQGGGRDGSVERGLDGSTFIGESCGGFDVENDVVVAIGKFGGDAVASEGELHGL
jgi:hypothetical protein